MSTTAIQPQAANLSFVETKEGIHTLFNSDVKEHYHSLFGSLQESMHVYIKNGFLEAIKGKEELSILEMGFGTGLNAILTFRENQVAQRKIRYTGIDVQPLPMQIVNRLNYFEYFGKPLLPVFERLHSSSWFQWNSMGNNFSLMKIETDILDHRFDDQYDLVYFDAFSPQHQAGLWQVELFRKIYEASNPGAIFVTYCAKPEVQKALESAGFKVELLTGAAGKKEMIRAKKV